MFLTFINLISPGTFNIFIINDLFGDLAVGNVLFTILAGLQFIITPLIMKLDKKISLGFFILLIFYAISFIVIPFIVGSENRMIVIAIDIIYNLAFLLGTYLFLGKKTVIFFFRFLLYSLYTLTWIPITIQGILDRHNKEWNPTKHVRSIEICDV